MNRIFWRGLEVLARDLLGDLELRRGTRAVVVDARAGQDRVEMRAGDDDLSGFPPGVSASTCGKKRSSISASIVMLTVGFSPAL